MKYLSEATFCIYVAREFIKQTTDNWKHQTDLGFTWKSLIK